MQGQVQELVRELERAQEQVVGWAKAQVQALGLLAAQLERLGQQLDQGQGLPQEVLQAVLEAAQESLNPHQVLYQGLVAVGLE